jgi:hypothetical protein
MINKFRREPFRKWCEKNKDEVLQICSTIWKGDLALRIIESDFGVLFDALKEHEQFSPFREKIYRLFRRVSAYEMNTDNSFKYGFNTFFTMGASNVVHRS